MADAYPPSDTDAVSTASTLAVRSAKRVDSAKKRIIRVVHNHIIKIHKKNGNIPPNIPSHLFDDPKGLNSFDRKLSDKSRRKMSSESQRIESLAPVRNNFGDASHYELEGHQTSRMSKNSSRGSMDHKTLSGTNSPQVEQLMSPTRGSSAYNDVSKSESRRISSSLRDSKYSKTQLDSGEPSASSAKRSGNVGVIGNERSENKGLGRTRTESQVLHAAAVASSSNAAQSTSSSFFSRTRSQLFGDNCSWCQLLLLILFLLLLLILLWWMFYAEQSTMCACLAPNYGCPKSDMSLYAPPV